MSRKGLTQGRVTWDLTENIQCIALARHGFHAATIAKATGLSVSQVHYRYHMIGLTLRGYRDGAGPVAKSIIAGYSVKAVKGMTKREVDALLERL